MEKTVHLLTPDHLPPLHDIDRWLPVGGAQAAINGVPKLAGIGRQLEAAFMAERETWWQRAHALGQEPTAEWAKMPTAGAFGCDFGVMLAWRRIVTDLTGETEKTLVVCDDPWLYRELAALDGVVAGPPPPLLPRAFKLWMRGIAVRTKVALKMAQAAWTLRKDRMRVPAGAPAILVYAHPASGADGHDAYFAGLLNEMAGLIRVLHTDGTPDQARALMNDRTVSLHGWGSVLFALTRLPFVRWQPKLQPGPDAWLIRRAKALENGGGGPAMTRWQAHCQMRWLGAVKPRAVAWPWENHAWERLLCRAARVVGVRSVGYQHTVIGPHQINYAIYSNPDGADSLPDRVVADGSAYADELKAWGVPLDRLEIGGAFRFERFGGDAFDPAGPVYVPLSAVRSAARLQIAASHALADAGIPVLIKAHPMYPLDIALVPNMTVTDTPLQKATALRGVLYTTGASALEACLMGVPGFRLLQDDAISIDVLPTKMATPAIELDDVVAQLRAVAPPPQWCWDDILSVPDIKRWNDLLNGANESDVPPIQPTNDEDVDNDQ